LLKKREKMKTDGERHKHNRFMNGLLPSLTTRTLREKFSQKVTPPEKGTIGEHSKGFHPSTRKRRININITRGTPFVWKTTSRIEADNEWY
jgi:hypothetical protein